MVSFVLPISTDICERVIGQMFFSRSNNYLSAYVHVASFALTQSNKISMKKFDGCYTINAHRCVCVVSPYFLCFYIKFTNHVNRYLAHVIATSTKTKK